MSQSGWLEEIAHDDKNAAIEMRSDLDLLIRRLRAFVQAFGDNGMNADHAFFFFQLISSREFLQNDSFGGDEELR